MTSEARAQELANQASEASLAASSAARHLADLTNSQHSDVLKAIDGINSRIDQQDVRLNRRFDAQDEHLERIETQVRTTNGRVTAIELWKAHLTGKFEGLAQGAGGTGRLLFLLLSATSLVLGIVLAIVGQR